MNPFVEQCVHERIFADLYHKALTLSELLDADSPGSGKTYTTVQAADNSKHLLLPYLFGKQTRKKAADSFEGLIDEYFKLFGDKK